jgi:hypothetical protein
MKKNTLLLIIATAFTVCTNAQTTLFSETFGTTKATRSGCTSVSVPGTAETGKYDPQKNELFTDHDWSADSHIWNNGIAYSQTSATTTTAGACDDSGTTLNIRTNNSSTLTGASGNGNLYFNANITNSFSVSGINTAGYNTINLSFEIYGKNKSDVTLLKLQYDNGSGFTDAGTTQIAALSTTKQTWLAVTGITLPASTSLNLKFSTPNTNSTNAGAPIEIRIDDIKITGSTSETSLNSLTSGNRKLTITDSGITLDGFSSGNIEIFNIQGRKVFSSGWTKTVQPQLAKGLYIFRIGDFVQKISL